jgi:fimbrial chaperone protein
VIRPLVFIIPFVFVLFLLGIEEGRTSSFNVSPLKIVLSGKSSSALLEITNQSAESLRLQLSVSAWDQSPSGEILLGATDDIILFPPLLTVEPGELRKIRLGAVTARGAAEKTYRVVLEELPAMKSSSTGGGQVRVLTRMTIPVFFEPSKVVSSGQIDGLTMQNATASFEIRNNGSTHFTPQHIRLTGKGAGGQAVATHEISGWYILAGGTRRFDVPLSPADCRRLKSLTVEAQTEAGPLNAEVEVGPNGCGH